MEEGIVEAVPFEYCWRNSGAVLITAPFLGGMNLAQFHVICAITKR